MENNSIEQEIAEIRKWIDSDDFGGDPGCGDCYSARERLLKAMDIIKRLTARTAHAGVWRKCAQWNQPLTKRIFNMNSPTDTNIRREK